MPQEGRITLQIDSGGGVYVVNKFKIFSEKYEKSMVATEIQPHDRLIDADALRQEIHCWYSDDLEILEHIDAQPTIIEADGE